MKLTQESRMTFESLCIEIKVRKTTLTRGESTSGTVGRKLLLHCSVWAEPLKLLDVHMLTVLKILTAGPKRRLPFPEVKNVLDLIHRHEI